MRQSEPLPASAPETQGIASRAILDFAESVDREIRDLHSFILMRHGRAIAEAYWEPFGADAPHMLFSLSKSFTSTAIGLLVAEGQLSVDDPVLGFFPDLSPSLPDERLRAMRVRHLLTMTTGHDPDPTALIRNAPRLDERSDQPPSWIRAFLEAPLVHDPGARFVYNSLATYVLSAIAQRLTGQRIVDYLQPRLFDPLGIAPPDWETSPEGINTGGWGLSLTTRDIARFGQLYLRRGVWEGRRLLPEAWVAEATSRQVSNAPNANPDWEQGYGYQFWRCRHNAYRGDGAFGQFCVVMPDQDAVLAVTAGLSNMQAVLDLVWERLLPAMAARPLPEAPADQAALADRLSSLRIAPAAGEAVSPLAARYSGREYALAENADGLTSLRFDFGEDGTALTVGDREGTQRIRCGYGEWVKTDSRPLGWRQEYAGPSFPPHVAASAAWTDERTCVVELCWPRTPFRVALTCEFEGNRLAVTSNVNVSFGPAEPTRFEGVATAPADAT